MAMATIVEWKVTLCTRCLLHELITVHLFAVLRHGSWYHYDSHLRSQRPFLGSFIPRALLSRVCRVVLPVLLPAPVPVLHQDRLRHPMNSGCLYHRS